MSLYPVHENHRKPLPLCPCGVPKWLDALSHKQTFDLPNNSSHAPGIKSIALICHSWYAWRMEFARLLEIVGDAPVFETGLLLAGEVNPDDVRRQLSRWTAVGRLIQLRRGIYTLAPPFQKVKPHPFVIANALVQPSYISLQAALAYYGLIPDYTPVTTSVTPLRQGQWQTALGDFTFRHIQASWWHGYRQLEVHAGQLAWIATPEKALLDLVYLEPGGDDPAYLVSLRLQGLERLDLAVLADLALPAGPKLQRAVRHITALIQVRTEEYSPL
ncbi:MAG: hypothetical protein BWY63_01192 [Chloroflexi bacterium ADurb.Bin360]|nr:MAG: hypothetical protein BWY63_01192 [Chloroflexi bacterium ADurb.Bin360]